MHISNHIQEWRRWKRLIKAFISLEFLLEWFLKLLLPYISKDVSTSEVQNEEQAIFRVHELDLIYPQSRLLYEITFLTVLVLVSTLRSNLDHMLMALLVVRVPNLWIWLWNRWANCQLINLHRDKPWLHLNLPKRWVYFRCNHWTKRVTSSLDGIKIGRASCRERVYSNV